MQKVYVLLVVFLVLITSVSAFTGIGENTSLILVSATGHLGGNLTGNIGTMTDADSRKTWNRVEGDDLIQGTYNNVSNSGRYGILSVDVFNPVITRVATSNVLVRQATVTWDTDEVATSVVTYGTAANALTLSSSSSSFVASHSVTLFDLAQNTPYFFNVTSCDRFGFCKYVGGFTFRTQVESPGTTDSNGFGGGGVSKTTSGYTVTKNFAIIPADKVIQIPIISEFIAFTKILIKLKKTLEKVEIKILRFNPKIPDAPELKNAVYEYIKVEHDKIKDEDVAVTTITFTVAKDWLSDKRLKSENVVLLRLVDKEWKEMPTSKISDSGVSVGYESTFQGLSYYAIIGKETKEEIIATEEQKEGTKETKPDEKKEDTGKKEEVKPEEKKETPPAPSTPPTVEKETKFWVGAIIFIVLLVMGYLIYRRMEQRER